MTTITIPQIDGGVRIIAISEDDAARVRQNPAMIDGIACGCIGELDSSGNFVWVCRGKEEVERDLVRAQARAEKRVRLRGVRGCAGCGYPMGHRQECPACGMEAVSAR